MAHSNTNTTYGTVTKSFHWLTALLILTTIPIGIWANNIAGAIRDPAITTTDAMLIRATFLFSIHKTIGVTIFFVALARIAWAVTHVKPGLLNGDNRPEAWAAETVHWLLYGSLLLVPLSGWITHAAVAGFAPIWWPFGQTLPFVPQSAALAKLSGTTHYILQWVLVGSIGLHIAGALKHHVIDGDATLRRMLPGRVSAQPTHEQPGHGAPLITALLIWAAAMGAGAGLGWFPQGTDTVAAEPALAQVTSQWQKTGGTLGIGITQLGAPVSGEFSDWTADITYDETPDAWGRHGDVSITIAAASFSLGILGDQAMGPAFLDAAQFSTARYTAELMAQDTGLVAVGTLSVKDVFLPLEIPVTLNITGDEARASGSAVIDRRTFNVGQSFSDPGALGFDVQITFDLTATRR